MEDHVNLEQEQNPQDVLNAASIFAKALGLILKDKEGIVVDITGNIKLGEGINKVVVFKQDEQMHIFKCEEDVEEGSAVNLNPTEGNKE